jgi:hypothetical protein
VIIDADVDETRHKACFKRAHGPVASQLARV